VETSLGLALTWAWCLTRVPAHAQGPQEFCRVTREKKTEVAKQINFEKCSVSCSPKKRCPGCYPGQLKTCCSCKAEFPHTTTATPASPALKAFQV